MHRGCAFRLACKSHSPLSSEHLTGVGVNKVTARLADQV